MFKSDFLSEFFFDILSYILPGLPLIWVILNICEGSQSTQLRVSDFFQFKAEHSWLNWVILFFLAYVIGMIISSMMFKLSSFVKKHRFPISFYLFFKKEKISPNSIPDVFGSVRNKLINEINDCFDVNLSESPNEFPDFPLKSFLRKYIQEKSKSPTIYDRFYDRFALMRNLSLSFLVVSISLFFVLRHEDDFLSKCLLLSVSILFSFIAFAYIKIQKKWLFGELLRHFYILRAQEKNILISEKKYEALITNINDLHDKSNKLITRFGIDKK